MDEPVPNYEYLPCEQQMLLRRADRIALCDSFALAVLPECLRKRNAAQCEGRVAWLKSKGDEHDAVALDAYGIADAMMRKRDEWAGMTNAYVSPVDDSESKSALNDSELKVAMNALIERMCDGSEFCFEESVRDLLAKWHASPERKAWAGCA